MSIEDLKKELDQLIASGVPASAEVFIPYAQADVIVHDNNLELIVINLGESKDEEVLAIVIHSPNSDFYRIEDDEKVEG